MHGYKGALNLYGGFCAGAGRELSICEDAVAATIMVGLKSVDLRKLCPLIGNMGCYLLCQWSVYCE